MAKSTAPATETTTPVVEHKLSKKERERLQEADREQRAKANAKDHHKKHGNN